jgi:plastocyanin
MIRVRLVLVSAASAACMSSAMAQPAASPAQTIQVYSYGFAPKPIQLTAGRAVTLNFVNQSGSGHDFTSRELFAKSRIVAGAAPNGEIDLGPRQSRSVTLIPQLGVYEAHCSHFMHAPMGMRTRVVVR